MATLNQCSFIGRLGKDPNMHYTPSGKAITKFSIAVDQGKNEKPMWLHLPLIVVNERVLPLPK